MRRSFLLCLGVLAFALPASFLSRVYAQQARTAKDGVYTAAQAKRGEAIYQARCVACHGTTLAGEAGPPLTGQTFLGDWDTLSLSDLFDKIHNTMPADAPGALTEPPSLSVVAIIASPLAEPLDVGLGNGVSRLMIKRGAPGERLRRLFRALAKGEDVP